MKLLVFYVQLMNDTARSLTGQLNHGHSVSEKSEYAIGCHSLINRNILTFTLARKPVIRSNITYPTSDEMLWCRRLLVAGGIQRSDIGFRTIDKGLGSD